MKQKIIFFIKKLQQIYSDFSNKEEGLIRESQQILNDAIKTDDEKRIIKLKNKINKL